jgi:hypothetical protein
MFDEIARGLDVTASMLVLDEAGPRLVRYFGANEDGRTTPRRVKQR